MIRSCHIAGAALAALITASAATADPSLEFVVHRVSVPYGDLDLSTAGGRAALQMRIDSAAAQACGGSAKFAATYRDAPQFHEQAFERCRDTARHEAVTILERHGVRVASR
jgi:UrcA family protein